MTGSKGWYRFDSAAERHHGRAVQTTMQKSRIKMAKRAAEAGVFTGGCFSPPGAVSMTALVWVFFATSGEALAFDECGPETPGPTTITCTNTSYANGINYGADDLAINSDVDGLMLVLDNPSMVVDQDNAWGAVEVFAPFTSANDLIVDVVNAGTITNTFRDGIFVENSGTGGAFATFRNGDLIANLNGIFVSNDEGFGDNPVSFADVGITITGGTITAPNGTGALAFQTGHGDAFVRMTGGQVSASEGLDAQTGIGGYEGNALVEMSSGTVTTSGFGARALNNGTGDAAVAISGDSNITTQGAGASYGAQAVIDNAASAANATVTMDGGAVSTVGSGANGLYALNNGTGNAAVVVSGDSNVTTTGDGAHGAAAQLTNTAASGDAAIQMNGGQVTTAGADAIGLLAANAGTGDAAVAISGDSNITTQGAGASYGAQAVIDNAASAANATVTMDGGAVSTVGIGANGLYALNAGTGNAAVAISGDSNVTTTGDSAHGAAAQLTNTAASGDAAIQMNGGQVTTAGADAIGLLATTAGLGNSAVAISGDSNITTQGAGASYGAQAVIDNAASAANATVTMDGGAVSTVGIGANGLYALNAGTGNAAVAISGDSNVTTTGDSAHGAAAQLTNTAATGDAAIQMNGGQVTTAGADAIGLLATTAGLGNSAVAISGDSNITTQGAGASYGAQAVIDNAASAANATVTMDGGAVSTVGIGANGHYALNNGTGNAAVAISGDSNVTTTGDSAHGAAAQLTNADGTGSAAIQMTGGQLTTAGTDAIGLLALNAGTGNATVAISGDSNIATTGDAAHGAAAQLTNAAGTGSAAIQMNGGQVTTAGAVANGLSATTAGLGNAQIDVTGGSVSASGLNSDGIFARSSGGQYLVKIDGAAIAGGNSSGAAIHAVAASGGTVDIGTGATIDGSRSGIAIRDGDADHDGVDEIGGNMLITTAGTITGDIIFGLGDDTLNLVDGSLTGDIFGGDRIAGSLTLNDGDDTFQWTGGSWAGDFHGQNGSDTVNISAAGYNGSQLLDGGDDVSSADGWIDRLALSGLTVTTPGVNIVNWEMIAVDQTNLAISDGALATGSEPGMGLFLTNGSTLNGLDALALTGNLTIDAGSTFIGRGAGSGIYSISSNVVNAGTITTQDGSAGDVVTIGGNYTGNGGTFLIDSILEGDASKTDRIIVQGDTAGNTQLAVNNVGGRGAQTSADGIELVHVEGVSVTDAFTLKGDYLTKDNRSAVVAGAYAYTLYHGGVGADANDGHWYLRSQLTDEPVDPGEPEPPPLYQASVPVYEAYPQALLALGGVTTLQQRVGSRYTGQSSEPEMAGNHADRAVVNEKAIWARIEGAHGRFEPRVSTSGTDYDHDLWKLQAGSDGLLWETDAGSLILGLTAHYGSVATHVRSVHGDGQIDTTGYGIGGSLTWYGANGIYVDAQAQGTLYDSNLSSDLVGRPVALDHEGYGYSLSLEAGERIGITSDWTLTPQAQLVYSRVNFDRFTDAFGAEVSLNSGDSLQGRLGLAMERQTNWKDEAGRASRINVYGIANLYNEFLDGTKVDVSGVTFASRNDRLWGGIGVGGTYDWADDKYELYSELTASTSLANFADSYAISGTIGLKVKW